MERREILDEVDDRGLPTGLDFKARPGQASHLHHVSELFIFFGLS
jgi:hypothetical protein